MDCDNCFAEFELSADGSTALLLGPAEETTTRGLELLNTIFVFDPNEDTP
uniref:Uncharacterized protein n=1 Tax=Pseudomonas savastanoi pv. savastanoi TaxID=360920 RepID=H1ZX20_PSESS|nr:hypothetical protein PSA3335_B0040 [Pseudomonas savastanoi pv. savastanoi]